MKDMEVFKKKICRLECTLDELTDFSENKGRDKTDFFSKYYSIETISNAIRLYLDGKITHQYLSEWAYDYALILEGYPKFNADYHERPVLRKDLIEILILDVLEQLADYSYDVSHFGENPNDITGYERVLANLDKIYSTRRDWNLYYCFDRYLDDNGKEQKTDTILIAFVNNDTKELYRAYSDSYCYTELDIKAVHLNYDALHEKVDDLLGMGFTELTDLSEDCE